MHKIDEAKMEIARATYEAWSLLCAGHFTVPWERLSTAEKAAWMKVADAATTEFLARFGGDPYPR